MKFFCPEMEENHIKKIVKDMASSLIQKKYQVSLINLWYYYKCMQDTFRYATQAFDASLYLYKKVCPSCG